MTSPQITIREYTPGDTKKMSVLWQSVFGDREEFVHGFYAMLPELGTAVVAEQADEIVGIAHTLSCMSLILPPQQPVPCGYLYAVAVDPRFRSLGLGAALSRSAQQLALQQGAEIFCTSPAELPLYQWYHNILQLEPCLYRVADQTVGTASAPPVELSASEYNMLREQRLAAVPHMALSTSGAAFLRFLCQNYGGGLYCSGDSIAAFSSEESRTVLYEVLSLNTDAAVQPSLFASSGVVEYNCPSLPGVPGAQPFLASAGLAFPADTVWNLVFE